jgi:hypothetical protein
MAVELIDISVVLTDKDYFDIKSIDTNITLVELDLSLNTQEKNLFELNYDV